MGLFDEHMERIRGFMERRRDRSRGFRADDVPGWPVGSSLILEEDAAIELGNPGVGSISMLMWSDDAAVEDGRITIVGPDLAEIGAGSVPLGQVIMVDGSFTDPLETLRSLRDAVYEAGLEGMMVRTLPSRQCAWCRVDRGALQRGLSLAHLGAALMANLRRVDLVAGAEVLFVTSGREDMEELRGPASEAAAITGALMKMGAEATIECDLCEYREVCAKVDELREMRQRRMEAARK